MAAPWRDFPDQHVRIYAPTEKGGRYRILYRDVSGKERERSGGQTERSALTRAQELVRQVDAGLDGSWTVGRLLDEYVQPHNHRTRRGRPWGTRYTEEEDRRVRLHIRPHLDVRKPASSLGPQDFILILNRAGATMAPSTVESLGATCRAIVSYGRRVRVIDGDPMFGVHYHASGDTVDGDARRIDPATIPEMEAVLRLGWHAAIKARDLAEDARRGRGGSRIVDRAGPLGRALQPCFAAASGLRFGELADLTADRVCVEDLTVQVLSQWVEPGSAPPYSDRPKHGKTREVVFAGWIADDLTGHIERRVRADGPQALLWPAPAGGHLTRRNHSRWWKPVREAAGWKPEWQWRGLRHLYAVTALAPETQSGWGMSLEDVSRLMGHHSPHFTARRYLTVRGGAEKRAQSAARSATL